jgi:hypothetical protein
MRRSSVLSVLILTAALGLPVVPGMALAHTTSARFLVGLGTAHPPRPDISADAAFPVYEWKRNGARYYQVNDARGRVLAVFLVTTGSIAPLPIPLPAPRSNLQGRCPCEGVVAVDGFSVSITLITNEEGRPIDVVGCNLDDCRVVRRTSASPRGTGN